MLTRKQAKNLFCMYTYNLESDLYGAVCKANNCPKWKDEFVIVRKQEYICPSHTHNCEVLKSFMSVCGKYGEENLDKEWADFYIEHCQECENHYGRCGG